MGGDRREAAETPRSGLPQNDGAGGGTVKVRNVTVIDSTCVR